MVKIVYQLQLFFMIVIGSLIFCFPRQEITPEVNLF